MRWRTQRASFCSSERPSLFVEAASLTIAKNWHVGNTGFPVLLLRLNPPWLGIGIGFQAK
jgi:hypothetical protein